MYARVKLSIVFCLISIILSSCSNRDYSRSSGSSRKTQRYISKKMRSYQGSHIDLIRQQEAKLTDIPPPLQARPLTAYCLPAENKEPDSVTLGYQSTMSVDEIKTFYVQEMERLGWQQMGLFTGRELLLSFEKPERLCTISIRPGAHNKNKTGIFIFSGNKQVS